MGRKLKSPLAHSRRQRRGKALTLKKHPGQGWILSQ